MVRREEEQMKNRRTVFGVLLLLAVLAGTLSGCSEKPAQSSGIGLPESYMITAENQFDYQPGLECSAFASAYVLRHFGEEAWGRKLFEDFPGKLSGGGVLPAGIEQFFRGREGGYRAEFRRDGTIEDLKQEISEGVPVIVFIHVEEPYDSPHYTHYLPLIGYDSEYFYFAESLDYLANCKDEAGLSYNRKTEISKFERLWKSIDATWDNPYFVITKQ